MTHISGAALLALGLLLSAAAVVEWRTGAIPAWLVAAGIGLAAAAAAVESRWQPHLAGAAAGLLLGKLAVRTSLAPAPYARLLTAAGAVAGPLTPLATTLLLAVSATVGRRTHSGAAAENGMFVSLIVALGAAFGAALLR